MVLEIAGMKHCGKVAFRQQKILVQKKSLWPHSFCGLHFPFLIITSALLP